MNRACGDHGGSFFLFQNDRLNFKSSNSQYNKYEGFTYVLWIIVYMYIYKVGQILV